MSTATQPSLHGNTVKGVLVAFLTVAVWSANFIIGRGIIDHVPPVTLATLRWVTAISVLLPFTLIPIIRNRRHYIQHWKHYALVGVVGTSMVNTFIYIAAHTVEALNLSLIAASSPLFVLIMARIFYAEPITYMRLIGIVVVLFGILLLITRGDLGLLLHLKFHVGDLYMLAGAFSFGWYTLLMRKQPEGGGRFSFLTVTFSIGLLCLLPFTIMELSAAPPLNFTTPVVIAILYTGIGASVTGFWLWGVAISYIGSERAAIVYYSMPLFCGIEAVIFLNESVLWVHYVSGALILGGLLVATRSKR